MIQITKLAVAIALVIGTAGSSANDALDAAVEDRTLVGRRLSRLILYSKQDAMTGKADRYVGICRWPRRNTFDE